MPETRALDEPLTDAELDELEAFLASDAVPQDCMDLEMLDGYLAAIASGPETIQPSEWLPGVWSEGGKSASPAYSSSEQAQRVMALMLRHMVGIERTLAETPTRFRPLLYLPDGEKATSRGEREKPSDRAPPEATAWCEGYMAGVKLRDDDWQPLYDAQDARDWIFPVEALAFGEHDPEFSEWIDDREKRESLVDELPVAAVLIYRFWQDRRRATETRGSGSRRELPESVRKSRQRLH
ncbi:MAG TPA: YecA family protein [Casimicrobiaceae bacterium]|nr:YecA family protein [Casimicrobiaceae bacterium]